MVKAFFFFFEVIRTACVSFEPIELYACIGCTLYVSVRILQVFVTNVFFARFGMMMIKMVEKFQSDEAPFFACCATHASKSFYDALISDGAAKDFLLSKHSHLELPFLMLCKFLCT